VKKIQACIPIVLCGIFFLNISLSQEITGKGIKGGMNLAKFTGSHANWGGDGDSDYLLKYSLGGFISYKLNDRLSLQTELLYTVKGSKFDISEFLLLEDHVIELDLHTDVFMRYLELPVLAVYHHKENINVFGGLYYGYFLRGGVRSKGSRSYSSFGDIFYTESILEIEDISKSDIRSGWGIAFGGTYYFNETMGIEARYSEDLDTFDKEPIYWDNDEDGKYIKGDIKNSCFNILFTYSL
jgi:hypothetical protein